MYKIKLLCMVIAFVAICSLNSLCVLAKSSSICILEPAPVVEIKEVGKIIGTTGYTAWTEQKIYKYLGIPYAESPSGKLRFKLPLPRKAWSDIFDASEYGNRCPEIATFNPDLSDNDPEDCLNLCVYSKKLTERTPVMVYVHGGGFYNGSAADYPPGYFLEEDIVLVVLQFRLGPLGWLSTKSKSIPGNVAMHDVILALQWVKKNIEHFGGDPDQVTIFSQSAGAVISSLLITSPSTPDGLFNRVIVQSGSILAPWATNTNPIKDAKAICFHAIECSNCLSLDAINNCLMRLSVERILNIYDELEIATSISTQDFYNVLPKLPSEMVLNYTRKYPIMGGVTKHDGSFVLAVIYDAFKKKNGNFSNTTPRQFIDFVIQVTEKRDQTGLIRNMAKRLLFTTAQLDARDLHAIIPGLIDLVNTITMKSPLYHLVKTNAIGNPNASYLYTFDYEGEHTRFGYEFGNDWYPFNGGIHHSNDLLYLFNTHPLNKKDTLIAKKMVHLWATFARTGIPQSGGKNMIAFTNEAGPYFHINEQITNGVDFLDELTVSINDPRKGKLIRPNVEF